MRVGVLRNFDEEERADIKCKVSFRLDVPFIDFALDRLKQLQFALSLVGVKSDLYEDKIYDKPCWTLYVSDQDNYISLSNAEIIMDGFKDKFDSNPYISYCKGMFSLHF